MLSIYRIGFLIREKFNQNELWSFLAQITNLIYGLVIFIIQSKFIDSEQLSIWYVFMSLIGFSGVLELGMNQLFSRHITYIKHSNNKDNHIYKTPVKIENFIASAKYLNFRFSILVSIISLIAGFLYLRFNSNLIINNDYYILWIFCGVGFLLVNINNFYTGAIQGINHIDFIKKNQIISVAISILISITSIYYGIISFVVAYLITSIYKHISLKIFFSKKFGKVKALSNSNLSLDIIKPDLKKNVFNMIGYKLVSNGYLLILGLFLIPGQISSFGLTKQVFTIMYSFSFVWISANFPSMSKLFAQNQIKLLIKTFKSYLFKALSQFVIFVIIFIIIYKTIIGYFDFNVKILDGAALILFTSYMIVEVINGYFAQLLIIMNKLHFMYFSFIFSIILIILTYLMLNNDSSLEMVFGARILTSIVLLLTPIIIILIKTIKIETTKHLHSNL